MRDTWPPFDEIIAWFGAKTVFSSFNFIAGYWQVVLQAAVRKYTEFVHNGRTYLFCVVLFGLNILNTRFGKALEATLNRSIDGYDDQSNDLHIFVDN